jgi:hypothetical protein
MVVHDLISTLNRPGVRVLNILAAATGGEPDVNDLDLKKTFSIKRCADFTTTYSYAAVMIGLHNLGQQLYPQSLLSQGPHGAGVLREGSAGKLHARYTGCGGDRHRR